MSAIADKVCGPQELDTHLTKLSRPLVMTNGVFDVLHRGHVDYLERAAQQGASLLVAINTDASVRMLGKGPDRPLNRDHDRAYVLAGLASVNLVTFFATKTPLQLIQKIRPEVYVKGGDYDMDMLEETHAVRSWGGQAVAIPFVDGFSTTGMFDKIRQPKLRKAVFLDRDGVINRDRPYTYRWEEFEFIPGAVEGMRRLQEAGFALVIITNQSGLARGYFTESEYQALTSTLREELSRQGVQLDGMYHCPHHPEGSVRELSIHCECRKPAPGMVRRAARELGLSLPESFMVGDKPSDIEAARAAGVGRAYLIGHGNINGVSTSVPPDGCYPSLLELTVREQSLQKKL